MYTCIFNRLINIQISIIDAEISQISQTTRTGSISEFIGKYLNETREHRPRVGNG